ncbi:amidohydrolase [Penicillium riverlandense]|uniref:amidohydrolase n=1 Tax=Penicillium riverlandense TaxID=1903569 RepID=UPI0025487925|nr:amidohydrolase [Penicillium riverlandense]KAJ5832868.1 amidohydrolase [Penicillium riverlandense]
MTQVKRDVTFHHPNSAPWTSASLNIIVQAIDAHNKDLQEINAKIHSNPELAFNEFMAHDNITAMLQDIGFTVTKHAYGLKTSFVAEYGSGGRVVAFNAEYDALPQIGHACGHNLIATSSIGAFIGLAAVLKELKLPGRVRIIGTPAEEEGGGKLHIIEAGAYEDVDACLMVHPAAHKRFPDGVTGVAYCRSTANVKFRAHFIGKPAHAATAPWQGVNALDAVCLAYNGVSMLRQQMQTYERVHGVITEGGLKPNIIPASASVDYYCRSTTLNEAEALKDRVVKCFDGAATATGCSVEYEIINKYADLRPNKTLCSNYASAMDALGSPVIYDTGVINSGSTDMGNVTYICPGFHGGFAIPADPGAFNHTPSFTGAAATSKAHELAIITAKGMAIAGWNVLSDDDVAGRIRKEFEEDKKVREGLSLN